MRAGKDQRIRRKKEAAPLHLRLLSNDNADRTGDGKHLLDEKKNDNEEDIKKGNGIAEDDNATKVTNVA